MINLIANGTMSSLFLCRFSMTKLVMFLAPIFLYSIVFGQGEPQRTDNITQEDYSTSIRYNLSATGILDDNTKNISVRPFCGVTDINRNIHGRWKRYNRIKDLPKWGKLNITWSLVNSNHRLTKEQFRSELKRAFDLWSANSILRFEEEIDSMQADIVISFKKMDAEGGLAGYAHPPDPRGIDSAAGDIYFSDDEPWSMEVGYFTVLFFNVAVHEIGHSLGLDHSGEPGSVMYKNYVYGKRYTELPEDLRNAMEDIYGKIPDRTTTPFTEVEPQCEIKFYAISMIRGNLYTFNGKFMWRYRKQGQLLEGYPTEIRRFWTMLPDDLTHVDAVHEAFDNTIIFFVGQYAYFFDADFLIRTLSLQDIGLPNDIDHVDAVMTWGHDKKTYIFTGARFWEYDEKHMLVNNNPLQISSFWRGVPDDIDAAFQYSNGTTYFFKGTEFWEFDDYNGCVRQTKPLKSVPYWYNCPEEIDYVSKGFKIILVG